MADSDDSDAERKVIAVLAESTTKLAAITAAKALKKKAREEEEKVLALHEPGHTA